MKKQSIDTIIAGQPHDYYCIVAKEPFMGTFQLPEFAVNGQERYIKEPLRLYSSKKLARRGCKRREESLHLMCLACFLNIVRSRFEVKSAVLNDYFPCNVVAWRAPCQTTAILTESSHRYYIEGCQDTGVFWRPVAEKPTTPPPFLVCGAQYIDCLWYDCPNGWEFMHEDPITLCNMREFPVSMKTDALYSVRFKTPEVSMFYAGISEEGFDFTRVKDQAAQLSAKEAKRVATAIANVQINWSGGMMSGQPGCRVVVANKKGSEILLIQQACKSGTWAGWSKVQIQVVTIMVILGVRCWPYSLCPPPRISNNWAGCLAYFWWTFCHRFIESPTGVESKGVLMNKAKLSKLIRKQIYQKEKVFFPDGYDGGECYLLNEEGFYGPKRIPDYVVPVSFSKAAESAFLKRIKKAGLDVDESEPEVLEKFSEGIDLDLDPLEFVSMLKDGCIADTIYLPGEWDHLDLIEACEMHMPETHPFSTWDSLTDEEVNWWLDLLERQ